MESRSGSDKAELEVALREMEQHMQLALHSNASPDKVKVDKEQLTLLYAALLVRVTAMLPLTMCWQSR